MSSIIQDWRPEPTFRGTYGILSICISTYIICVWTTTYIDIPPRKYGMVQSLRRRLNGVLKGVITPSVFMRTAVSQLYSAIWLSCDAYDSLLRFPPPGWFGRIAFFPNVPVLGSKSVGPNGLSSEESPSADSESIADIDHKHPWTLTHGFYAAMGGFVLEASTLILGSETRFVLTPAGVRFLMRHAPRLIPDLSEDSLLDRSKADGIQKFLFLFQVFYFCVSCAERHAQLLSLSLLEVSTLAHALCTFIVCLVWWKKPLNINEPTVIDGDEATGVAALLLVMTPRLAGLLEGFREWDVLYVKDTSQTQSLNVEQGPGLPTTIGQENPDRQVPTSHADVRIGRTAYPPRRQSDTFVHMDTQGVDLGISHESQNIDQDAEDYPAAASPSSTYSTSHPHLIHRIPSSRNDSSSLSDSTAHMADEGSSAGRVDPDDLERTSESLHLEKPPLQICVD